MHSPSASSFTMTKEQYESLLDKVDRQYLKKAIQAIDNLLNGTTDDNEHYFAYWSFVPLANTEKIKPIYSDTSEKGIKRSYRLIQFSNLSESISKISWREGGIKDHNPHLPWENLEKIGTILHQNFDKNPNLLDKILIEFEKDLKELKKRLVDIDTKYYFNLIFDGGSLEKKLFANIDFKSPTANEPLGLPHIRKLTEFILDIELFEKICLLMDKLTECDAQQEQGREAILGLAQVIGELAKGLSLRIRSDFPFYKQLKLLREEIGHVWEKIGKSELIFSLIMKDTDNIIEGLKQQLLNLKKEVNNFYESLKKSYQGALKQPTEHFFSFLPLPCNAIPYLPKSLRDGCSEDIENICNIFKDAIPPSERNSIENIRKLNMIKTLLSGNLSIPILPSELEQLILNFESLLGGPVKELVIKHWKLESKIIDKTTSKPIIQWKENVRQLLSCPKMDEALKKSATVTVLFKNFLELIKSAPDSSGHGYSYEEYQLRNLYRALNRIHDWTALMLKDFKGNPSELRKKCRNTQFHQAILFNFTIIGQCIQNLKGKSAFRTCVSDYLRKEFEALRWIRNGLMHDTAIDESGSILQYFGNDLIESSLAIDGGRAFDSDIYLKELHEEIEKTILAINNFHAGSIPVISLEENEFSYYQILILQSLKEAAEEENQEYARILLDAMNIKIESKGYDLGLLVTNESEIEKMVDLVQYEPMLIKSNNGHEISFYVYGRSENGVIFEFTKLDIAITQLNGLFDSIVDFKGKRIHIPDLNTDKIHEEIISKKGHFEKDEWSAPVSKAKEVLKIKFRVNLQDLLNMEKQILFLCEKHNIEILGLFGSIVKYSFEHENKASGILIKYLNESNLLEHANFKMELYHLLGKEFLIVTGDDIKEYLISKEHNDNELVNILTKIEEHSFYKVMRSYELFLAVEERNIVKVNEILTLTKGKILLDLNIEGYTALHSACMSFAKGICVGKSFEIAEILLYYGADSNRFDKHGKSPLHYAAKEGNAKFLLLLLKYQGNPNLKSEQGDLPLQLATRCDDNFEIYKILLPVTNLTLQDKLIQAIRINDFIYVKQLVLNENANINLANEKCEFPLHVACEKGNFEIVKFFHNTGIVDINKQDADGETALHKACYADNNPNVSIVEFLLHLGIDFNIQNSAGQTALYHAAYGENNIIIRLLISKGADKQESREILDLIDSKLKSDNHSANNPYSFWIKAGIVAVAVGFALYKKDEIKEAISESCRMQ